MCVVRVQGVVRGEDKGKRVWLERECGAWGRTVVSGEEMKGGDV